MRKPGPGNNVYVLLMACLLFNGCRTGIKAPVAPPPEAAEGNITQDTKPFYPGGEAGLQKFINVHINYPEKAIVENIEGKVLVSFIVNKEGRVVSPAIVKGLGGGIDEEVIRVVNLIEGFRPATQNGKPANYQYTIPINFMLPKNLQLKMLKLKEENKAE